MVSFPEAVKMFFQRYTDFQGRSRRSEYWWVALFNVIIGAVVGGLAVALGGDFESGNMNPIGMVLFGVLGLYFLAVIIPSIALFVRRLHDINQTGWIYLGIVVASFIPVIGLLASIASIVIACIPGTKGPNKYGDDPINPGAGAVDTFA
ncbi:MAG TPA: DUF805 domain-containing protein [Hyphomonas sp.]|nr:DUF805 domain-containing protein [Hyphomonas sp.]